MLVKCDKHRTSDLYYNNQCKDELPHCPASKRDPGLSRKTLICSFAAVAVAVYERNGADKRTSVRNEDIERRHEEPTVHWHAEKVPYAVEDSPVQQSTLADSCVSQECLGFSVLHFVRILRPKKHRNSDIPSAV